MQRTANGVVLLSRTYRVNQAERVRNLSSLRFIESSTSNVRNQVSGERHLIILSSHLSCRMFHTVQVTCIQDSKGSRVFVDSTNSGNLTQA